MPGPVDIFKAFFVSFVVPVGQRTIQEHALMSLVRVLVGYALGITLGIMAGIGMGVSKTFEAIFQPIFEVLRPIPTIAWIPLAILWFGVGEIAKYYIIFYSTFVILTINSYAAVRQVSPELIRRSQNAWRHAKNKSFPRLYFHPVYRRYSQECKPPFRRVGCLL